MKEKKQCSKKIWDVWSDHPCNINAIIERDGKLYCKIHDPEYIKEKDRKAEEKYKKNDCKCDYHFDNKDYYKYCPLCGTKR